MKDSDGQGMGGADGGERASPSLDNILKALNHPLRRGILRRFHQHETGGRSPVELARELNKPLSKVGYHVRVLAKKGLIGLTDELPTRGSVEHVYASNVAGDQQVESILIKSKAEDE
ncbi:MAG TPA: helix-turn-helix domain-containing protein [Solirubrobacterales bacterium]